MNINKALRYIRRFAGITQTDLNERLSRGHAWANKVEKDEHTVELQTLELYAKAFDIPLYKIIKFAEVIDECTEEFSALLTFASIYMEE